MSADLPARARRTWQFRATAEHGSIQRFVELAAALRASGEPQLAELADQAAADERDHRDRCEQMVVHWGGQPDARPSEPSPRIVPHGLPAWQEATWLGMAHCALSESINAVLLQRTLQRTTHEPTAQLVRYLLADEVRHGQLGWAILQRAPELDWLDPWMPRILAATVPEDVRRSLASPPTDADDLAHGLLGGDELRGVLRRAVEGVILPGLAQVGAPTASTREWWSALALPE